MAKKSKKTPIPLKYLIKREDKIFEVHQVFFENCAVADAFILAAQIHFHQKKILYLDAVTKKVSLFEDINILEALENSMQKLKDRFPSISGYLAGLEKSKTITKIGQS